MTEHTEIAFLVEFTTLTTPPSESDITGRILSAVESVDHPEGITGLTVTEMRREALKSEPMAYKRDRPRQKGDYIADHYKHDAFIISGSEEWARYYDDQEGEYVTAYRGQILARSGNVRIANNYARSHAGLAEH